MKDMKAFYTEHRNEYSFYSKPKQTGFIRRLQNWINQNPNLTDFDHVYIDVIGTRCDHFFNH